MYSIAFPNMFQSAKTNLVKDHEATISNLRLLLASWKTSLFGDPYFGTNIKRFLYEQNNTVLRDIIIDSIYVSILDFMPQIYIQRKDIKIKIERYSIYCQIYCINKIDNQPDTFTIKLTED